MKDIFGALKGMLGRIHWKQFAVTCSAVVVLLAASGVKAEQNTGNRAYSNELPPTQDVGRPRTMGQWEAEKESLEGQPGKRIKRIAEESADAVKDMAGIYPQNARTLTPGVDNGELPNDD